MCIITRTVLTKRDMVRVVRTPDVGVQIDPTGKRAGRGAYLKNERAIWLQASKNGWAAIARALNTELTADDRARLQAFAESLPAEPNQ